MRSSRSLLQSSFSLLLIAGACFSLLKGLDWEEATILVVGATALFANPRAFHRKGDWRSFRPTPTWLALIVIVLAFLTLVGFLAFRHVDYESHLWWEFAWDGDAPRFLPQHWRWLCWQPPSHWIR